MPVDLNEQKRQMLYMYMLLGAVPPKQTKPKDSKSSK